MLTSRVSLYWRHVLTVFSGATVAQGIPIAASLAIARIYQPADFGLFSVWLGLVLFFSTLVTARFETALAIVPDGLDRSLAVLYTSVTTFLLSIISGFVLWTITTIFGTEAIFRTETISNALIILIVPASSVLALLNVWQSWAAADGSYRSLVWMRILQASSIAGIQILFGLIRDDAETLAIGHLAGATLSALFICLFLKPLSGWGSADKAGFKAFFNKYRKFPVFALPAAAINTAAAQLPIIVVAARFGPDSAGVLAMTIRILGAPIALLANAVLDVFKRYASVSYRELGNCRVDYIRTFCILLAGAILFCLGVLLLGKWLFTTILGETWSLSAIVAVWLLPMFAMRFIASPLSFMVYIAEKQHLDLLWQLSLFAMTLFALYFGSQFETAIKLYSIGYSLLYAFYLWMSYNFSKGDKKY